MKTKLGGLKEFDPEKMAKIKEKALQAGNTISDKAAEIKTKAVETKEEIGDKLTELDRMLETLITECNDTYTLMNDKGVRLYIERSKAVDTISFTEELVDSIANRAKSFDAEFE